MLTMIIRKTVQVMTREREREDNLKHDMTHQRAARTQGYII